MAECCNDNLSKIFCNAYNKYYNTLYTNGEINKKETENLLVISYLRKLFINPRYIDYRPILIKALRCIADRSCLLDSSQLYGRLDIKTVSDKFVTVQMRDIYSIKETDPTVPQYVKDITEQDITNWNNKISTETDPVFTASPAAGITSEDISNWNNPPSGGALIVTVTLDGTYSADKTFTEILTAWNSGQDIIVYYSDAVYQVSWIDDGGAWFFRTDKTNAGPYVDYFAVDGTDDSWTKNTYNLQTRLTFDNNPTQGSNNPVKSSGIYNMCPIIEEDTRSASTAAITALAPFASLVDGQRIVLKFKESNAANPTLTLTLSNNTTTSAIPLYYRGYGGSKKPATGFYVAGAFVSLVYDLARGRWMATNTDYDFSVGTITQAEIDAGTATGARAITPKLLRDNFYTETEVNCICPIIEDTRSSAVAAITGVAPFASLVDGQRIILHVKYTMVNNSTLELTLSDGQTTTGAIGMWSSHANANKNTTFGTIYGDTYWEFIYNNTDTKWVMVGQRDTNTTYPTIAQSDINAGTVTYQKVVTPKIIHENCYIEEIAYTSSITALKANKMYDFGTVSTALTIPSLDATNDLVSNALNFYALRFIAGADNLNITFPTGVIVDDTPTINTGDYVEIMINLYVENNTNHFYASIKVWQAPSQNS